MILKMLGFAHTKILERIPKRVLIHFYTTIFHYRRNVRTGFICKILCNTSARGTPYLNLLKEIVGWSF